MIGLVPQEIRLEPFEIVVNTVRFSRGLFGHSGDNARIEEILRKLSLWDKRRNAIKELSGGGIFEDLKTSSDLIRNENVATTDDQPFAFTEGQKHRLN